MSKKLTESESLIDQHISSKSNKLNSGVTLTRVSQISNSMFPRARTPGMSTSRSEISQTSTADLVRAFAIKADPSSEITMSGRSQIAKNEGCLSSSVTTSGSMWVSQQPDASPTQGFSSNQSHQQPIIHPASNLFNIHRSHESIDSHVDDIQIPKLAVIPRKGNNRGGPEEPGFMEELTNMFSLIEERLGSLPQLSIARVDPLSQVFSLRWNNHQSNLLAVFDQFLQTEAFCDVTLACDGASIKCHKMVLAACSNYFEKLFMENSCEHPIVFLKEVKAAQVQVILDYMYKGEVSLARDELPGLLHLAELLRVKGLIEEDTDKMTISKETNQRSPMPGRPSIPTPDNAVSNSNGESGLHTSSANRDISHLPPTSAPPSPLIPHFRPFLRPPGQGPSPPFPMWPLPGLMPGAHNLFHPRHDLKDLSPGIDWTRNKLPGFPSARDLQLPPLIPRESADSDKPGHERHNGDADHSFHKPQPGEGSHHRQDKSPGPGSHHGYEGNQISPGKLEGIAGYVPTQRLEWKRYKQYTRSDIMAAIEEVKKGMSALQASRKFGVPSRTLYDKVKKMGITTGRQQHRKHMPGNAVAYSAAFPGINLMSPLSRLPDGISMDSPYQDLIERMKEADDNNIGDTRDTGPQTARSEEGVDPTTRGPIPPILPPQMLNMMKQMKGQGEAMNLTNSQEREGEKRMSEGNIAQSTSPSSREMTSPINRSTNSPRDYQKPEKIQELENRLVSSPIGGMLARNPSPHHIDIRARFLADLSRLAGGRPLSPVIKQEGGTSDENLPPRKRKVSQEVEDEHGKMLCQEKNLNGMHDGEAREHTDGSSHAVAT